MVNATGRRGKGNTLGNNEETKLDRTPKEGRLTPKGNHFPKGTLDAKEPEEQNGNLLRNEKDHQKPP